MCHLLVTGLGLATAAHGQLARSAAVAAPLFGPLARTPALTLDKPGLRAALAIAPLEGSGPGPPRWC